MGVVVEVVGEVRGGGKGRRQKRQEEVGEVAG